ncbi:superoxide dismutase family protein [Fluviispira multicolorata]|uniref:Superoxide dismutase family protein n=1 Tax=Fluviispira multicolorata TaxID=2654512 RepID=A0A833JHJ1_9BACT|nr:superoxide dismutase family protein [Fluviispira multicolorata]KAB8033538.1 superoxide dismutase family protein [Fluviispira multicolorata]
MKLALIFSFITLTTLVGCQTSSKDDIDKTVKVKLEGKSNSNASGQIQISEFSNGGIQISGKISGLSPNGTHGFHFHENGDCSDLEAMKAGGHFNPDKTHTHGKSIANSEYDHQHAGDLGNIISDESGNANIKIIIKSPALTLSEENKYSLIGRALVIHANKDDEKTAPAGNAGKRILCGVIKD